MALMPLRSISTSPSHSWTKIFLYTLIPCCFGRSASQQDQSLHTGLINAFNHLGALAAHGKVPEAIETLVVASECEEVGLGTLLKRRGKRIGSDKAGEIIDLFRTFRAISRLGSDTLKKS
jgi:hypothetical protein